MKKILFFLFLIVGGYVFGQTPATLDYSQDFEGTSNWTLVNNNQTNKWMVGAGAASTGTKSLYISYNNNANQYLSTTSISQAYRDFAIPANVTSVQLSFDWKANGEQSSGTNYDFLRVWIVPSTFTPTPGAAITAAADRIQINGDFLLQSTFTNYSTSIVVSQFAGSTMRLVYEWQNDAIVANDPPAAIDNIVIKKRLPCVAPTTQPTALLLTAPIGGSTINGSFTAATNPVDNYLVVISTSSIPPTPVSGTTYAIGSTVETGGYRVVDTDNNTTFTAKGLTPGTLYYVYIFSYNSICTGGPLYNTTAPLNGSTTTTTVTVEVLCIPKTVNSASKLFIKDVAFLGMLQGDTNFNNSYAAATPGGYQDFTSRLKSVQAQGEGVNIYVGGATYPTTANRGHWKAWVDWNKDGVFTEPEEKVYDSKDVATSTTTFGFVIPPTTAPGDYRIRIRFFNEYKSNGDEVNYAYDFSSCESFSSAQGINRYGEAEDYLFTVIASSSAVIKTVIDGQTCGSGSVVLSATGSPATTSYRWYTTKTGGSPINGETTNTYTTPVLASTNPYYVTALNGSLESPVRTEVKAIVNPIPTLSFTPSMPEICGSNSQITIAASGDKEKAYLINENFEAGNLGVFSNKNIQGIATTNAKSMWQNRKSTFVPAEKVWFPAISSGFGPNKFVMATSDVGNLVENALESSTLNSIGFENLTLSFRIYFSSYLDGKNPTKDYVKVEVSTNNGTSWDVIDTYTTDQGIGTKFEPKLYPTQLNGYIDKSNLKIRFHYYGEFTDGVAIDDVQLYGNRPLTTNFTWTGDTASIFKDCSSNTAPSSASPSICFKPSESDYETKTSWTINATATLSNGCAAVGTIVIPNTNKVWSSNSTTWTTAANWKPDGQLPDLTKCVIVKTPVVIPTNVIGLGKEVTVQTGGTLNIQKDASLKVQNQFVNSTGNPKAVLIESDGGLVQVNEGNTINTGNITAQRTVKLTVPRQQYNYIISPLEGQNLKSIYPGITYVLYHNETNNYFYNSSGAYIKGRGLAVKEPTNAGVGAGTAAVNANFEGYPTNGAFTYSLVNTAPLATPPSSPSTAIRGYNLVGNPYPSNIDLNILYDINGGNSGTLSQTFYFWDSTVNDRYVQEGSKYDGKSYGSFNAASPPGTGSGVAATGDINSVSLKKPKNIVKMGQGFMVRSTASTMQMKFNNTIRTTGTVGESYFGKNIPEKTVDRYWLKLVSPTGIAASCVVVYFPGGDNGFARDDSFTMGGSDVIYSQVENQKLAINGRSSFTKTDVVPLGTSQFGNGYYKIGIETAEGIFQNDQPVYLKDLQTGIITNLSEGDYVFAANAGESTGRFEIIYEPETVLATGSNTKEGLVVYRDGGDFVVKSSSEKISHLAVYDAGGRLIYQSKPNTMIARVENSLLINGVYVLKIDRNGTVTHKKILK